MDDSVKYFISNARRSGYNDAEIKKSLMQAGWNEEFVDLLLGQMPGETDDSSIVEGEKNLKDWVKQYFRSNAPRVALLTGASIFGVLVTLFQPWAVKFLVDSVFDTIPAPGPLRQYTGTVELLTIISVLMVLIFAVEKGFKLIVDRLARKYSFEFDRSLKSLFFGHLMRLPLKFRPKLLQDSYYIQQVSSVSSDVAKIVIEIPVSLLSSLVLFVSAFIIMVTINPLLAFVSIMIIPAIYGAERAFEPQLKQVEEELDENSESIERHAGESTKNMQIIQSFGKEDVQTNRLIALLDKRFSVSLKKIQLKDLDEIMRGGVLILGIFTIIFVGGREVFANNLTVGELFIFVLYIDRFYGPIDILTSGYSDFRKRIGRVRKFYEMLNEDSEIERLSKSNARVPKIKKAIEFKDTTLSIDDEVILKNVNLKIPAGKRYGFIGPAGSGKSTLIESVALFSHYSEGSITIDGIEIAGTNVKTLRDNITMINDDPQLFSDSILNNILYAVDRHDQKVESKDVVAAVEAAGAREFIEGLPKNYETNLAKANQFLSPGQRLKIAIARAFLRDAPILIIDEPTAQLDPKEEKEVLQVLFKLMEGKTVLLASKKLSLLTQMDKVYVLDGPAVMDIAKFGGLEDYSNYLATHELI